MTDEVKATAQRQASAPPTIADIADLWFVEIIISSNRHIHISGIYVE